MDTKVITASISAWVEGLDEEATREALRMLLDGSQLVQGDICKSVVSQIVGSTVPLAADHPGFARAHRQIDDLTQFLTELADHPKAKEYQEWAAAERTKNAMRAHQSAIAEAETMVTVLSSVLNPKKREVPSGN